MKKHFLYYIVEASTGRFFTVDSNGIVKLVNFPPTELQNTPEGWREASVRFGRSEENIGIIRAYSIPMKAVLDGAVILKHIYYTLGVNFKADLIVAKLNTETDIHEPYFRCRIDLKEFLDKDNGATITMLEGGLIELIRARANQQYEIPINVPEAEVLVHDGIELVGNRQFLANNGPSVNLRRSHVVGLLQIEGEGTSFVFGTKDTTRTDITNNDGATIEATGQYFLEPTVSGNVEFEFDLTLKVTRTNEAPGPSPAVDMLVHIQVQNGTTILSSTDVYFVSGITAVYGPAMLAGKVHRITGNFTVNVPEGAQVYLITDMGPIDSVLGDVNTLFDYQAGETNFVRIKFVSRGAPTRMQVLRPEYVFKELIRQISGGLYTGESTILTGALRDFVVTSGDGIRSVENAVLKTSLNDFVKSYDSSFAVRLGVTDTNAILEGQKYFYADNYVIDLTVLGDVNNLSVEAAKNHFFSEIQVGSPSDEYEDVNGRQEFNTVFRWGTVYTGEESVLDKISTYRKDGYGIEFQRLYMTGKPTTDNLRDNSGYMINVAEKAVTVAAVFDVFEGGNMITLLTRFQSVFPGSLITVTGTALNNGTYTVVSVNKFDSLTEILVQEPVVDEAAPVVNISSNELALNRPLWDAISGVLSDKSIYNVLLSPKRALLAHGPYIRSGLDLEDATFIEFRRADKNDALSTTLNGVTVTEKANTQVSQLGAKLFRPHVFKFETQVPLNLVDLVSLPPNVRYGKVKFSWKGIILYGYILDIGQVPELNPKQTWELLCAPETNLLPLINAH